MARDLYVDTTLEFSKADLDRQDPGGTGQMLLDKMRPKVDAALAQVPGARLALERGVELHVGQGEHLLTREPMVLIAARWPVIVPDSAQVPFGQVA